MGTIGDRLREERERLGYNQEDFGEHGGVRRKTQGQYERNERTPDSDYLAGIAVLGADVRYIVTGKADVAPHGVAEAAGIYALNGTALDAYNNALQLLHKLEGLAGHEALTDIKSNLHDLYRMASGNSPLDIDLLESCIEAAALYLELTGKEFSNQKKAKLVAIIYDNYKDDINPVIDSSKVIKLIELGSEENNGKSNSQKNAG